MDKDQSYDNARKIASETEIFSDEMIFHMSDRNKDLAKKAIKDYVASSKVINNSARESPRNPNQGVINLDQTLRNIQDMIETKDRPTSRIVYRLITYDDVSEIPYGSGQLVDVGSYVGDLAFTSTSEHRQFILGKLSAKKPKAVLKIAMLGNSGVPIAIDLLVAYSNKNMKKSYDNKYARKNKAKKAWKKIFGKGPQAGQAEVLFPRKTVFKVRKIKRNDRKGYVSVVMEEVGPGRRNGVLNSKFGTALT